MADGVNGTNGVIVVYHVVLEDLKRKEEYATILIPNMGDQSVQVLI